MRITRIAIIRRRDYDDRIILETNLPSAAWPDSQAGLMLDFVAAGGTGVQYCRDHFPGVPVDVSYHPDSAEASA